MNPQPFRILGLLTCGLYLLGSLYAQEPTMRIKSITHNDTTQTMDIAINFYVDVEDYVKVRAKDLQAWERIGNSKDSIDLPIKAVLLTQDSLGGQFINVLTQSKENLHHSDRTYIVQWIPEQGAAPIITRRKKAFLNEFNLREPFAFLDLLVLAFTIIAVMLLLLSELTPLFRRMGFHQKYVRPYHKVRKQGETKIHPITGEPLHSNEPVVSRCNREMCNLPLSVWKRGNYQCSHYPDICEGTTNIGSRQFFLQQGVYRQLNWLWFGAMGGMLAWLIFYGVSKLLNRDLLELQDAFMGMALGGGIMLMLAWVEERGQGRGAALMRIMMRVALGILIGGLIFFLGAIFQEIFGSYSLLIQAPFWLLFGFAMGSILSIQSSIPIQRGMISGLIAGAVSFLCYAMLIAFLDDVQIVRMLAFIVYGAVLGAGIIQVVKQLEQIELQVLQPAYRSGSAFSLDTFLKTGKTVIIGRDMKRCAVRVKWDDDYVLPEHAELSMRQNKVYIKPIADAEVWVNDTPLTNKNSKALEGGERIRLGRHSQTAFKYVQKKA